MIATGQALRGTLPGWPSVLDAVAQGGTVVVAGRESRTLTVVMAA